METGKTMTIGPDRSTDCAIALLTMTPNRCAIAKALVGARESLALPLKAASAHGAPERLDAGPAIAAC